MKNKLAIGELRVRQQVCTHLRAGATNHENVQDVGSGIKLAAMKGPFGNIFAFSKNHQYGEQP
ncbi:MAG: hypothetical protein ABR555_07925 [Pyrinomonadaceae bacterium]